MEMSRGERGASMYEGFRNDLRRSGFLNLNIQPFNRPWRQRVLSSDRDYLVEETANYSFNIKREFHRSHPYKNNQFLQRERSNIFTGNASALVGNENKPRPLLSPETVERLRSSLSFADNRWDSNAESRMGANFPFPDNRWDSNIESRWGSNTESRWDSNIEQREHDQENNSYDRSFNNEPVDMNDYYQEEEDTKRKIEEIIMVAQALRDRLDREEMRRMSGLDQPAYIQEFEGQEEEAEEEVIDEEVREEDEYLDQNLCEPSTPFETYNSRPVLPTSPENIPRLMDLKPVIPCLMDLNVPPPAIEDVMRENVLTSVTKYNVEPGSLENCWNCDEAGHKYVDCDKPKMKKFCYRCGRSGFDVSSCPYCRIAKSIL